MKHLPTALLILLYVYAACSKLADPEEFRGQLYNQPFPHGLAGLLLYALPLGELLVVALLLLPGMQRRGLQLSLGLLALFTGYIVLIKLGAFARIPCSCGGILSHMGWTTHFFFNLFFILINVLALKNQTGEAENLEQSRHQTT
jgi:hypothetical protein